MAKKDSWDLTRGKESRSNLGAEDAIPNQYPRRTKWLSIAPLVLNDAPRSSIGAWARNRAGQEMHMDRRRATAAKICCALTDRRQNGGPI
jgi:hypothetical protein